MIIILASILLGFEMELRSICLCVYLNMRSRKKNTCIQHYLFWPLNDYHQFHTKFTQIYESENEVNRLLFLLHYIGYVLAYSGLVRM
jgi:hypothetical protein